MEFSIVIMQFNVYIYIYNFSNICAYIIFKIIFKNLFKKLVNYL